MAIHRVRCRMRFASSSGMAAWVKAQMDVRYGQAVHINAGLAEEEQKRNEIATDGDFETIVCDLPLMNEAHALDAFATLTDASVMAHIVDDEDPSWIEHHVCRHDETPNRPCEIISKIINETNTEPEQSIPDWEPWDGANESLYQVDDEVMHNGQHWISTTPNNHWEPGVYGWVVV